MKGDIWGRNYKLTIRPSNGGEALVFEPPTQIVFNVTGAAADSFFIADIAIYGISQKTRERIYKYYDLITLEAGYGDQILQIFHGQINNVETNKDNSSTVIKFYCWSNFYNQQTAKINQSWGNSTPAIEIIRDVAKSISDNVEIIGDFSNIPPAMLGETFSQNSIEALKELSLRYDFAFTLSETALVIAKNGYSRAGEIHQISAQTGMEGFPRIFMAGIEVDTRLNNKIRAFDIVEVFSDFEKYGFSEMYKFKSKQISDLLKAEGQYRVITVAHKGDFYHDIWTTTISAILCGDV